MSGFSVYRNGDEATRTRLLCFPEARHYILLFGVYEDEDGKWQWKKDYFGDKPSRDTLKNDIDDLVNSITDQKILSDYVWHGNPVWLSTENQFNLKAAFDIASMTGGATLPAKYKIGSDSSGNPIYHDFVDLADFSDFYMGAIAHIQSCISEGWKQKDSVDYDEMLMPDDEWEAMVMSRVSSGGFDSEEWDQDDDPDSDTSDDPVLMKRSVTISSDDSDSVENESESADTDVIADENEKVGWFRKFLKWLFGK